MTKIKNTKKGMAKKTLSMSLVVAMLATSNVPVWAAEFSDGTDAAVETEADTFTADETEAPVVEDTDAADATATTASVVATIKETGWGTAATIDATKTLTVSGLTSSDQLTYMWYVNGVQGAGNTSTGTVAATTAGLQTLSYTPTKDECGKGLQLVLTNTDKEFVWESNTVAISKKSITNATITFKSTLPSYNGKTHADASEWVESVSSADGLTTKDFDISVTTDKNLVDCDSNIKIRVTPKDTTYYTGETVSAAKNISPITWKNADGTKNFKAEFVNKEFEYTGSAITLKPEDIKVTETLANEGKGLVLNSKEVISNVWDGTTGAINAGTYVAAVSLDNTKLPNFSSVPEYVAGNELSVEGNWKIVKRDLANTKITINTGIATQNGQITDSQVKAAFNSSNTVTDLKGNAIVGLSSSDFDVKNIQDNAGQPGYYTAKLVATSSSTNFKGETTVTFRVYNKELTGATFDGLVNGSSYATASEEYTGEPITKDASKLGNLKLSGSTLTPGVSYDTNFQYTNNTDAGQATLTVKGLNDYAGSELPIHFTINAAKVTTDDKVADKVVFVDDSTMKAEAYAPAITVKAKNANGKEFTLEKDKDYTVTYEYVDASGNALAANADKNVIGNKIKVVIKITNKNFKGGTTQFTEYATISTKQLTNVSVATEKSSYVYTGEAIIPNLIVKDGTTELEQNVDYTIQSISNNKETGTATVVIAGKGEYDTTSTAKTTFTITAASMDALTVSVLDKDYTGSKIKPGKTDMTIKLGDVVIDSDKFVITYPDSKDANKQVGTGTFTLTPDKSNTNFTGTKEVTFNIVGKKISGGTLRLYKADGTLDTNRTFDYDGTAHTYAKASFVYFDDGKQLVEGTDYEIKYFNNVTGDNSGKGYVAVIGKGNYGGNLIKSGNTVTLVDENGKSVTPIQVVEFDINKLTLTASNVKVSDGEYAEGLIVKPNVVVTYGGNVLKEGTDYEISDYGTWTEPSATKHSVTIKGKGGYSTASTDIVVSSSWAVVKKDLAKCDVKAYKDATTGKAYAVVMNGSVRVPADKYVVTEDGNKVTVTPIKGSKYYTGSQTVTLSDTEDTAKPGTPMISNVKVVGNKATVVLSGESDGAAGYDYVISTDRDCITNKNYDSISKNQVQTSTTFKYVQQGTYYAYCHAWKRDANGKKVFSDWSNAYPFMVSAITPDAPVITDVKVSGSTIKVTYKAAANATGYDVVLGTSSKKENGETRPYNYGAHKVLNLKEGTVTATFKNVPAGKWTVGMHAFNRTSEDGKKVFSPWSNLKTATVK